MDFSRRIAFPSTIIFAVTGVLIQLGLWLLNTAWLTSLANILYIIIARDLATAQNVMHPPPSHHNSGLECHYLFITLNFLTWIAGYF